MRRGHEPLLLLLLVARVAATQTLELGSVDLRGLPAVEISLRARDGRGGELAGLRLEDFDVRLDGARLDAVELQTAEARPNAAPGPPPTFLLVDRSGDLGGASSHNVKKAAAALVDALPSDAAIALSSFDASVHEETPLELDHDRVQRAIVELAPGRGTSYVEPLRAVVRQAEDADRARAVVVFVLHESHYPGARPSPGRAYSLPGYAPAIYPIVVGDDGRAIDDVVARVVRRLVAGLPGSYQLRAQIAADGQFHTISVALRNGGASARCRFRAMRGLAIEPSKWLDREVARRSSMPWRGAFVGSVLGAMVLLVVGRRGRLDSLPVRLTPILKLCVLGLGAVAGAVVGLLAFPSL